MSRLIAILILVLCSLFATVRGSTIRQEVVTIVSVTGYEIECETADGNIFAFNGRGYKIGREYLAEFETCGTTDRTDDIILSVE